MQPTRPRRCVSGTVRPAEPWGGQQRQKTKKGAAIQLAGYRKSRWWRPPRPRPHRRQIRRSNQRVVAAAKAEQPLQLSSPGESVIVIAALQSALQKTIRSMEDLRQQLQQKASRDEGGKRQKKMQQESVQRPSRATRRDATTQTDLQQGLCLQSTATQTDTCMHPPTPRQEVNVKQEQEKAGRQRRAKQRRAQHKQAQHCTAHTSTPHIPPPPHEATHEATLAPAHVPLQTDHREEALTYLAVASDIHGTGLDRPHAGQINLGNTMWLWFLLGVITVLVCHLPWLIFTLASWYVRTGCFMMAHAILLQHGTINRRLLFGVLLWVAVLIVGVWVSPMLVVWAVVVSCSGLILLRAQYCSIFDDVAQTRTIR